MRLGGRLSAAIEVLDDIETRRRPVADALKDWGLSHRFAGAGDRAAIGNLVYDALRRKRSAAWLLNAGTSRALAMGALLLEGGIEATALNDALAGDRHAPSALTDDELALSRRAVESAPDAIRADIPDWCVPLFQAAFGDEWIAEGAALARRPPLDLRVNTLLSSRERVSTELADTGAVATAFTPSGLRITPIEGQGRHPNVQAEPAFQQGWFEVQDEGSQLVAVLAGAQPNMQVLDFCAGAGGKTLALAAAMQNQGRIVAYDSQKQRLAPIFDRLRRSGATNVEVVARKASLDLLRGAADLVLVDAPCTGSGTWRRRPDAKWRLAARQLDVRRREQAAILDDAARYVRPGGRLCYVTCSVFREENGDQIEAFRKRTQGFAVEDHRRIWNHAVADDTAALIDETGIALSPFRTRTDGFFFSALRRRD